MVPRMVVTNFAYNAGDGRSVGFLLIVPHITVHTFQVIAPLINKISRGVKVAVYDDDIIPQPIHLSKILNLGIDYLLEDEQVQYVSWIHDDMYFMHDWVNPLIQEIEASRGLENPIAKIGPANPMLDHDEPRQGNQNPWIMPRWIAEHYKFDEVYIGIGGFEDWDLNSRLAKDGYRVWITTSTWVAHEDRGTRRYTNWTKEELHNKRIYDQRWEGKW